MCVGVQRITFYFLCFLRVIVILISKLFIMLISLFVVFGIRVPVREDRYKLIIQRSRNNSKQLIVVNYGLLLAVK